MFERLFGRHADGPGRRRAHPARPVQTDKFPVLHYGSVPKTDLATWDFRVFGEVDSPFTLTWDQFKALPRKTVTTDIHCVTRWSKLDTTWEGVPIQDILELAQLRPERHPRPRPLRAGLHRQPAARGPRRRRRPPGRHLRRRAARAGARLPAPAARPEALLLEERQVDPRPRVPRPRPARLLGALRLQQRRRPLEGRALQRVGRFSEYGCHGWSADRFVAWCGPRSRTFSALAPVLPGRLALNQPSATNAVRARSSLTGV